MELAETADGVVVLNDAYNANPASMDAALRALAQLGVDGRRIAVLGDMRELGTHSASAHEAVGRLAGELGIDVVIGVGAGGAEIADAARRDVRDVRTVADADEAAATVLGARAAGRRGAGEGEPRVGSGLAERVAATRSIARREAIS